MKALAEILRHADPLAQEPPLDAGDVHAMREQVVLAARDARCQATTFTRPGVIGALAGTSAVAGLLAAAAYSGGMSHPPAAEPAPAQPPVISRVYFETPGGTRVVWFLESTRDTRREP